MANMRGILTRKAYDEILPLFLADQGNGGGYEKEILEVLLKNGVESGKAEYQAWWIVTVARDLRFEEGPIRERFRKHFLAVAGYDLDGHQLDQMTDAQMTESLKRFGIEV
jgi:hypothetical protein